MLKDSTSKTINKRCFKETFEFTDVKFELQITIDF